MILGVKRRLITWSSLFLFFFLFPYASPVLADYEITDSFGKHRFKTPPTRVVTTDWALLEQLLELGIEPIGAPELAAYRHYVQQPQLPAQMSDIGLRRSPSLAQLQALKPEIIILGTDQKDFARPFSLFSRVLYYKSFSERYRTNGKKSRARFLQLAELFQKTELAEQKLAARDARIEALKKKINKHFDGQPPAVTTIRFSSVEKCLVYGDNSMPMHALKLLGLRSDFPVKKSKWGEKEIRLQRLQTVDEGYLVYFLPVDDEKVLQSKAWRELPLVKQNRAVAADKAWSYGGAMSILYIAEAITEALLSPVDIH